MLKSAVVVASDGPLALELAQYGYRRASFLELHCGCNVRIAVAELLNKYQCPVCRTDQNATFLAQGFTRRPLPFTEQISRALETPFGRRWLKQQRAQEQAARKWPPLRAPAKSQMLRYTVGNCSGEHQAARCRKNRQRAAGNLCLW